MTTTLPIRRMVGAALVAGAGAAASWAVRRYLEGRRRRSERATDREMLQTWENEGGSPAAVATPTAGTVPS